MIVPIDLKELGQDITSALRSTFRDKLLGVAFFGSLARGEAEKWSDIDLFVLLRDMHWNRDRKNVVYLAIDDIRRKYHVDTTVVERDISEVRDVDRLLIDLAADGIVLYDRDGVMVDLLSKIRTSIERAGLVRYKTEDGKYGWKLGRRLRLGERFSVTLEQV